MLDAESVRKVLQELMDRTGVQPGAIATATGLHRESLQNLLTGKTQKVHTRTAAKFLALTEEKVLAVPTAKVPAKLSTQLINSMRVQGWSLEWQAEQAKFTVWRLQSILDRTDNFVMAATQASLLALAGRVGPAMGPSWRATRYARAAGWHPLAAYDENGDLIPEAVGDDSSELVAAQVMQVLELAAKAVGNEQIAHQTGVSYGNVRAYRAAAGLNMVKDGRGYKHKDPERAAEVLDVCRSYEWDGWTAVQSLEKLDVKVIERKKAAAAA
jgi:lambda repressor-like predicted transcriptional regulator